MKTLIVTIDADANVKVEAEGYKGKACSLDSKILTDALGVTTKDVKKPEFSMENVANQKIGC